MRIKCIGTGSNGNCYSLTDNNGNILLLDAGLPINEIKIGIDFKVFDFEQEYKKRVVDYMLDEYNFGKY